MAKALRLIDEELDTNYQHTLELNQYLKEQLKNINQIKINSNEKAIPHILNISVMGIKPETMQHALEEYDIYISTQSACSSNNPISRSVLEATKMKRRLNIVYVLVYQESLLKKKLINYL